MKWSEKSWSKIENCYQEILKMPFIKELSEGTLSKEIFSFYIAQDAIYLDFFAKALAIIGAKSDDTDVSLAFYQFAESAIVVERTLHETYFKEFEIDFKVNIQPVTHHYAHFLRSTAAFDSIEIGMAALLPCFWIYKQVGDAITKQYNPNNNPYENWIKAYSSDEFTLSVKKAIDLCDKVAEDSSPFIREKMTEAFIVSSHLEFQFWQAAYEQCVWKSFEE